MSASTSTKVWGVVAAIERDLSRMLDAQDEAKNNLVHGEQPFLLINLRSLFSLACRIHRRRKRASRLMKKQAGRKTSSTGRKS